MPGLFRHPVARVVTVTALLGSLADWVLFATLVVTVDQLLGGGPWATALVLLVRIVPGVLFAPLAARRVDGADLRQVLRRHEVLRVGAVATLLGAAGARSLPVAVVGLVALEFAAAMQAAARESTISRHVPPATFTALNTATAVLAYGMLPVGPLVVAAGGAATGWTVALAGYGALVVAYHRWLDLEAATRRSPRRPPRSASPPPRRPAPPPPRGDGSPWPPHSGSSPRWRCSPWGRRWPAPGSETAPRPHRCTR